MKTFKTVLQEHVNERSIITEGIKDSYPNVKAFFKGFGNDGVMGDGRYKIGKNMEVDVYPNSDGWNININIKDGSTITGSVDIIFDDGKIKSAREWSGRSIETIKSTKDFKEWAKEKKLGVDEVEKIFIDISPFF